MLSKSFFFLPNITLSFCCAPDSFILFPLPIEHFTIDIIQVNWGWGTWQEKNHTAEYRMPVACTLNSASSSTLPNFDPLIFSSVCSSFFTTNLSSHCKPQQWLWLSLSYVLETVTFSPCRWLYFLPSSEKGIIRWQLFSASHQQTCLPILSFLPSKNVRVILKVHPSSWNVDLSPSALVTKLKSESFPTFCLPNDDLLFTAVLF